MSDNPYSNYPRDVAPKNEIDFGAFGRAFEFGKANVVPFIVSALISVIVSGPFSVASQFLVPKTDQTDPQAALAALPMIIGIGFGLNFVQVAVQGVCFVAMCYMLLAGIRRGHAEVGDFIEGAKRNLVPGLLVGIVYYIATMLGLLACCIGIIVAVALFMFAYCEVAEGVRNPIEALMASMEKTRDKLLAAVGFSILAGFVALSGILACGIGILFTFPLAYCAICYVYLDLTGTGAVQQSLYQGEAPPM